jgi:hypothetical protein
MTAGPAAGGTRALAGEILARILPLPLDERKAVMDALLAAVIADCERRAQPPLPLLPAEPAPRAALSPEEAAARVLDEERWGPVCYGEDCDGDESRPHIHCPWGGLHRHVLDRATGKEVRA